MKKFFISLVCLFFILALSGCGRERVVNITGLNIMDDTVSNTLEVYYKGHVFDGTAWNKDQTFSLTASKGKFVEIALWHTNGLPAVVESPSGMSYYNIDSEQISQRKFAVLYPDMEDLFVNLKTQYFITQRY